MDCNEIRIACQLDRIAETLSAQSISWLDVVAGIVVPVLLGVATLVVAFMSVRTARGATDLNRKLHDERTENERQEKRLVVADVLADWYGFALFRSRGNAERMKVFSEKADNARTAVQTSLEPEAKALHGWLLKWVHEVGADASEDERNEIYRRGSAAIAEWSRDPDRFAEARRFDARLIALNKLANSDRS